MNPSPTPSPTCGVPFEIHRFPTCLLPARLPCCWLKTAASLPKRKKAAIEVAIRAEFDGLIEAAKSLDADRYLAYFDDKRFTGLNADGTVTHSLEEFAELYRKSLPLFDGYEYLEFFRVKITVLNRTTAVLVNEYQADIKLKKGDLISVSGGGTQVWNKRNGEWLLVSVSSASPKK